jgi:glycerol uptake facilitator protein
MDRVLRTYLAELVGTFVLVFLCAVTVCAAHLPLAEGQPRVGLVGLAVAQGCVLAVLLSATTLVSGGCLNPAVTLTLWVTKRFEGRQTLALIAVQLMGAVAGGGLALVLFKDDVLRDAFAGTPHLKAVREEGSVGLSAWLPGVVVEAGLSFLLTLAVFATIIDPRRPRLGGVPAGLALTAAVLAGYHLTGAAVNPARWFGSFVWQSTVPALKGQNVFDDHPVYWMGPILGALLAGIVYTGIILPPEHQKEQKAKQA